MASGIGRRLLRKLLGCPKQEIGSCPASMINIYIRPYLNVVSSLRSHLGLNLKNAHPFLPSFNIIQNASNY